MSGGRAVGLWPATGTVFAAALALGLSTIAHADELSDLRANQELLQRRLDQLAQIPNPANLYPGGPRAASAGQGLVGGSFPRSWQIPGTDTSLRVGGNSFFDSVTFLTGGNPNQNPETNNTTNNGNLNSIALREFGRVSCRE